MSISFGSGGAKTIKVVKDFVQENEPFQSITWFKPSEDKFYVYYGDFNTEDATYKQKQMPDAVSPGEGETWHKTDTDELFVWVE